MKLRQAKKIRKSAGFMAVGLGRSLNGHRRSTLLRARRRLKMGNSLRPIWIPEPPPNQSYASFCHSLVQRALKGLCIPETNPRSNSRAFPNERHRQSD